MLPDLSDLSSPYQGIYGFWLVSPLLQCPSHLGHGSPQALCAFLPSAATLGTWCQAAPLRACLCATWPWAPILTACASPPQGLFPDVKVAPDTAEARAITGGLRTIVHSSDHPSRENLASCPPVQGTRLPGDAGPRAGGAKGVWISERPLASSLFTPLGLPASAGLWVIYAVCGHVAGLGESFRELVDPPCNPEFVLGHGASSLPCRVSRSPQVLRSTSQVVPLPTLLGLREPPPAPP